MGIRIIYILSVLYGVVSSTGILRHKLPMQFSFILAGFIAFYFLFYAYRRKIIISHTLIGGIIVNLAVQLNGGLGMPLAIAYFVIIPIIAYKEEYLNYWIFALSLWGIEVLSSVFSHEVLPLHFIAFLIIIIICGLIRKKAEANEAFLKKSLIKYEAQEDFFHPAAFMPDAITTPDKEIDQHKGIERPLLFFVKFVDALFDAYSTVIFSFYNNQLTLIQGFSHSELFQDDTVLDLSSGIYKRVIYEKKIVLIEEFVQNPEELGYYRGEIKVASVMLAPLIVIDKVVGVLVVDRKNEPFTEPDKEHFDQAAKVTSYLLALLRLYEKEWYKAKYLDSIAALAERFHKGLELDKILPNAISSFRDVLKCNDVTIAEVDELNETGTVLESTYIKRNSRFPLSDGLVGFIAQHKNCILKEDLSKGKFVVYKKNERTKNLSFIGVPIMQEDSLLGVVWCEDHKKEKFSEDDTEALNILASNLSLVWQRAIHHEQEKAKAARDGLTGLYNHRQFQEMLEKEIEKSRELVLIMFDIDHFKKVNDKHGHQAGDKVIKYLANLISHTGIAARYGGEEFAIILPSYSLKKGIDHAVRIKDHLLKSRVEFKAIKIGVKVSIGVAHYPTDAETREKLIGQADRALYVAKETGRDKIVVAKALREKRARI